MTEFRECVPSLLCVFVSIKCEVWNIFFMVTDGCFDGLSFSFLIFNFFRNQINFQRKTFSDNNTETEKEEINLSLNFLSIKIKIKFN